MSDIVTGTEHLTVLIAKDIVLCNTNACLISLNTLDLVTDLSFSLKCSSPSQVFAHSELFYIEQL